MQQLRVCTKCQVATVLGNSFLQAVKGSAPEIFTSNEPGFRSRQCAFTKNQRLSFQWISPMNSVNSHKQSKVLRTVKMSWVICSLILLNSFQSVTEITNCKIATNLERSVFFFLLLFIFRFCFQFPGGMVIRWWVKITF